MLLRNLPQALHSAEHVAAPQQDAATDQSVAALGNASNGRERRAPIVSETSEMVPQAAAVELVGSLEVVKGSARSAVVAHRGRWIRADGGLMSIDDMVDEKQEEG